MIEAIKWVMSYLNDFLSEMLFWLRHKKTALQKQSGQILINL